MTHPFPLVLASWLVFGCSGERPAATPTAATRAAEATSVDSTPERPPVVIAIVVDQLAAWLFDERYRTLPADGGFARLMREGSYVRDVRYSFAANSTTPGHATLYTGRTPREHGAEYNYVIEEDSGQRRSTVYDASTKLVAADGVVTVDGASLAQLRVRTLADAVRERHTGAFIASLSIKDRGALYAGGRSPDAVLWFDTTHGFVTSTAFANALPAWAAETRSEVEQALQQRWTLLDPDWVKQHAFTRDDAPGEGDYEALGVRFDHDLTRSPKPASALRVTPQADVLVLELGERAIAHAVSHAQGPVFVALSLSALDYVGHVFGPDSWEWWDTFRRLDTNLGAFFATLDVLLSPSGYAVALTGDHGVVVLPETLGNASSLTENLPRRTWCAEPGDDYWQRPCTPGTRIDVEALEPTLRRSANQLLGDGRWITALLEPRVELSEAARALPPARLAELEQTLVAELGRQPGIASAVPTRTLPEVCPGLEDASIEALVCRGSDRESAAIVVVPSRGSFFAVGYTRGSGTNHGSPYLYDRAVPLLLRAPGRVRAGHSFDRSVDATTFTLSLAALLDVPPPCERCSGESLVAPR